MSAKRERDPLVVSLEKLHEQDDRGAMAALRRGLSPGGEASVYPYVIPYSNGKRWLERAYLIAAPLFATHPSVGGVKLGEALRAVALKTRSDSVEKRFVALLNAHIEELPVHLRHAVALARTVDIALDWDDIVRGLIDWDHPDRWVQRMWATAFWSKRHEEETTP